MKISYSHLQSLFKDSHSIEEISGDLFQLGHEHEIENNVFNFEFTPNRGDCLSLFGIARDLKVFHELDLSSISFFNGEIPELNLDFHNLSATDCPSIYFLNIVIEDSNIEYKDYLNNYFTDLGISKNNFFTDISNYVAYELGQPTHAYDFLKMKNKIILRENDEEQTFKTLLGKEIKVSKGELIFENDSQIINLAGIIGGAHSACSQNTKNVLIESAFFNPEKIIGKATKHDINSEASYKFERGVDPLLQEKALRRYINIVKDHVKIKEISMYSYNEKNFASKEIPFSINQISSIIGKDIQQQKLLSHLENLSFEVKKNIIVPSHRFDISTINDIAEEIGRVEGYNNIEPKPFEINVPKKEPTKNNISKIKDFLVEHGFAEVINFPFTQEKNNSSIHVLNPLDKNKSYLRTNLKQSLVNNLIYNENRQKDSIKLFEISEIYSNCHLSSGDKRLGIICSGRLGNDVENFSKKIDREYLLAIFEKVSIELSSDIEIIDRLSFNSKKKSLVYYLELKVSAIEDKFDDIYVNKTKEHFFVKYEPISDFPSSSRDFSFSIKDHNYESELINLIENTKIDNLREHFIFDRFHNKETGEIKLGFRFIFQSKNKTLSELEIKNLVSMILKPALAIKSVSVPGLEL